MAHSAGTSSGPLLFLRFVQQALLCLAACWWCLLQQRFSSFPWSQIDSSHKPCQHNSFAQGPSLAESMDSEWHTFQVFISSRTVVTCCILQQWRWSVYLSPWILLHPTAHILLFLSHFSPSLATPFCSILFSPASSHKRLTCKLLSLHCAEQTYLTSDLTATSKDSGETQALRFLHKTQLTLRKTCPGCNHISGWREKVSHHYSCISCSLRQWADFLDMII